MLIKPIQIYQISKHTMGGLQISSKQDSDELVRAEKN